MADKQNGKAFVSTSGAGVEDVRALLAREGWTMERDKAYKCRRWILRDGDGDPRFIRYNPTMGEMLGELQAKGVKAFVDEYETPTDGTSHKDRKQRKLVRKAAAAKRGQTRANGPRIAELKEKHVDLVLKRMKMGITADEKAKVKAELVAVREEILSLGGDLSIGTPVNRGHMSKEEMEDARKRGEERRKEQQRRKDALKNARGSGPKLKRGGSRKEKEIDDAESYDELMEG